MRSRDTKMVKTAAIQSSNSPQRRPAATLWFFPQPITRAHCVIPSRSSCHPVLFILLTQPLQIHSSAAPTRTPLTLPAQVQTARSGCSPRARSMLSAPSPLNWTVRHWNRRPAPSTVFPDMSIRSTARSCFVQNGFHAQTEMEMASNSPFSRTRAELCCPQPDGSFSFR